MCGILGMLHDGTAGSPADLRRGLKHLASRGPDGDGIACLTGQGMQLLTTEAHTLSSLLLAHCRLAILDQSSAGSQPMLDARTGDTIVFNGEIFNFLELREQLLRDNPSLHFESESDTEVLLKGWQRWREDLFPKLNGMWSLLLYDAGSRELIACRDRMGVKPLYIHRTTHAVYFASEIPALLAMAGLQPEPDPSAIFDYLFTGIVDATPDRTFYRGIAAVAPGELWRIDPQLQVRRMRYHQFDLEQDDTPASPADLFELMESSTALRLRSDAPTVSLLSGGLDSPFITALASRHGHDPRTRFVGAYTYAYTDDNGVAYDESERAAYIARTVFPHCTHTIYRTTSDLVPDDVDRFFRIQAEPTTTPSLLASLKIYGAIRESGVRVVLSSEGADELFGGYPRPYLSRALADALLRGDAATFFRLLRSPQAKLSDLMSRISWHLPRAAATTMLRSLRINVQCIAPELWEDMQPRISHWLEERTQPLQQRLQQDVLSTLLPHVLRCADRNSMANSVEVRTPFLDYRIVQYALRRPWADKVGPQGTKLLLRRAARQILPEAITTPPKKLGFGHAEQYRLGNLHAMWLQQYDSPQARAFVIPPARAGNHDTPLEFWWPYSVARWVTSLRSS
ncbi:asparagine synthase (glutamine-hydrolyzing) [Terriglobus albidus]|uniref:asparagine synthase (glutamine-hydrolyzing) n=1 Tax=Terriglobus albidus TaxID=1592106 RepID=UPI0021E06267|nr:asparagine synthase (glutamine-hydrolyzing) [Terriglobus albidus]